MVISFNHSEIETILAWKQTVDEDTLHHYGGGRLVIPIEERLLTRLRTNREFGYSPEDEELEIISDWMESAIGNKIGSSKFLIGYERDIYFKLKGKIARYEEVKEIELKREIKDIKQNSTSVSLKYEKGSKKPFKCRMCQLFLPVTLSVALLLCMVFCIWLITRIH